MIGDRLWTCLIIGLTIIVLMFCVTAASADDSAVSADHVRIHTSDDARQRAGAPDTIGETFSGPFNVVNLESNDNGEVTIYFDASPECPRGGTAITINVTVKREVVDFYAIQGCNTPTQEDEAVYLAVVTLDYIANGFFPIGIKFNGMYSTEYLRMVDEAVENALATSVIGPAAVTPHVVYMPMVVMK